jgi:hypothetical protein
MDNIRIKGCDKNLMCRDVQFEIGKEYKIDSDRLALCTDTVFHYCKTLQQVHDYYSVLSNNRFCYIEVLGEEIEERDKCGSNHIRIVREISGEELDTLMGRINGNLGIFNTGDKNNGNFNTGYKNTGNLNTGDMNAGYRNTGDKNTGHKNTGYKNTGDFNTGDFNTGNYNTGDFNKCNNSGGFFCTEEPKVRLFNKETDMTMSEFSNSKYYRALWSSPFNLIEERGGTYSSNGTFVKYTFEEACAKWWAKMSDGDKHIIREMPNFDAEIFEEITGIKEEK